MLSLSAKKLQLALLLTVVMLLAVYRAQQLNYAIGEVNYGSFTMTAYLSDVSLPSWVEWIRRIALMCLFGLMLWLICGVSIARLPTFVQQLLIVMICWRLLLAVSSVGAGDWHFSNLFDQVGVFVILSSILLAVGASPAWEQIPRYFFLVSGILSVVVLVDYATWEQGNRAAGIREFRVYNYLLMPVLLFSLAYPTKLKWRMAAATTVITAFIVIGVATETRATFVFLGTSLAIYAYLRRQSWKSQNGIIAALMIVGFSAMAGLNIEREIGAGLGARLFEDTRSEQLFNFLRTVNLWELIFGSPAAGNDPRFAEEANRWGVDSGILTILYVGGIPLLASYVALHIWPAAACLRLRLSSCDAAAVATVLAFSIQMLSSEMPALSECYLLMMLAMGRCLAIHHRLNRS